MGCGAAAAATGAGAGTAKATAGKRAIIISAIILRIRRSYRVVGGVFLDLRNLNLQVSGSNVRESVCERGSRKRTQDLTCFN
jgi:hypothetical protein